MKTKVDLYKAIIRPVSPTWSFAAKLQIIQTKYLRLFRMETQYCIQRWILQPWMKELKIVRNS